jgi:hypothetical protein
MQRYILDYDDVLGIGFLSKPINAQNLIAGLNASGVVAALNTDVGGTGSTSAQLTDGETLIFDATQKKLISSGYAGGKVSISNDSRYYTKSQVNDLFATVDSFYTREQIDALFTNLASAGGPAVNYANITNAPAGSTLTFLAAPLVVWTDTGSVAAVTPTQYMIPTGGAYEIPESRTVVAALVTVTMQTTESSSQTVQISASATAASPIIQLGWARGSSIYYSTAGIFFSNAGCDCAVVPVDSGTNSLYYAVSHAYTGSGTITIVGYIYY